METKEETKPKMYIILRNSFAGVNSEKGVIRLVRCNPDGSVWKDPSGGMQYYKFDDPGFPDEAL